MPEILMEAACLFGGKARLLSAEGSWRSELRSAFSPGILLYKRERLILTHGGLWLPNAKAKLLLLPSRPGKSLAFQNLSTRLKSIRFGL